MLGKLRIGIDGRMFDPKPKGVAKYISHLCIALDALLPEAEFFVYARKPITLPVVSLRWHTRVDQSLAGRCLSNTLWLILSAGFVSRSDNLDLFWGGDSFLPLLGLHTRTVLTVHDLVHRIAPETCSSPGLWSRRLLFHPSLARADAVVTNSSGTARRLLETFSHTVAAVARPGLSPSFRPASEAEIDATTCRLGLNRPYLLSVATREPRKNLPLLIRTFLRMKEKGLITAHKLVLAGDLGWKDRGISAAIARAGDSVRAIGYVPEDQLAALYSGSDAFVFPSKYEGFGMPVLEARACGTRVVTTDIPELKEAGGKDTIYITPTEADLCAGILRALASPAPKPLAVGSHSWTQSASAMAEVFQRLASSHNQRNGSVITNLLDV
jgi:glycosyltransferase involved in cell wall biosynthesis